MAIERVADLTSDPQLRSRLADELERYATRAWRSLAELAPGKAAACVE